MDSEQNKFKTSNVVSIAATHFLHDTYSSFFAPLIPLLSNKLGFTYAIAGVLSVVQKLPSLLNPFIGLIADKTVIRSGIVATPIITIITMSLMGLAPSVTLLAVLLFACGISAAVLHVTAPVLMRRVSGSKVGRGMSFFMFGGELARTIGPLVITAAVSWWGLEGTWRLIPFGLAASLLLFLNLRTIDKEFIRQFTQAKKHHLSKSIGEVIPFFAQIGPIILFRGFSNTALTLFLPSYMVDSGYSIKAAACALAVLELAGAGGALMAGSLSDKTGRKKVLLAIMLLSPLLMLLFTVAAGIAQWLLLGLMGLVFFASTPVFMAMIHDLNSDRPSFANGLYMTLNFAASSIVALLVGVYADHHGLVATYRMTALLGLLAIPPTLLLKDKR
ncbi:MFS transporter [Pontiella sulfatireligans]|uniref:Fosmidomycin resistance protein n=1 Tax=Pontiella sulfatireligans TaxID=2750658 RepID=A0A6C2UI70_9BACT|nr:MFS transporter [Pontiella sulfatireligans]VGO19912.1 Fosmidomycin resistance protein [Pontiella sulfatireligans]